MIKLLVMKIIFILIIIFISGIIYPQQRGEGRSISSSGAVTASTNVHYTGKYCEECHEKKPDDRGNDYLKYDRNFNQLCWCHISVPGQYTHPVDIEPSEEKKAKIPPDLPLYKGKLSCSTCHDIYMQCREDLELKYSNRRFLRGAPFRKRTDLCFKCHDKKKYRRLDPHVQLDKNGDIIEERCLYCHIEKPDELRASFKEVKLIGDLLKLCQRCHMKPLKHPADANHIVMPSLKILEMIKKTEKQFGIVLPLDNDGKMFCATCHNPHQKGVIPYRKAGARGASENSGQRFPGKICLACHEK